MLAARRGEGHQTPHRQRNRKGAAHGHWAALARSVAHPDVRSPRFGATPRKQRPCGSGHAKLINTQ